MATGFTREIIFVVVCTFLTISLLIVFGNIMVLLVLRRVQRIKVTTRMFMVSLSMADLFVGCILIPLRVNEVFYAPWTRTITWCQLSISMNILNLTASALNLLVMIIDRWFYIRIPLRYDKIVTRRRSAVVIATVWTFVLSISFVPIFSGLALQANAGRNNVDHLCKYATTLKRGYLYFMVAGGVICLLTFSIVYFNVVNIANKQIIKIRRQLPPGSISSAELKYLKHREKRNTRMLACLIATFYVCWIPEIVAESLSINDGEYVTQPFIVVISFLVYSNSYCNCAVYYFCNKEFRKHFKKLLHVKERPLHRNRQDDNTQDYTLHANSATTTPTFCRRSVNTEAINNSTLGNHLRCSSNLTEIMSSYL